MAQTDAFALKNLGVNEFLFAEIGVETNGSPVTILSLLARLGRDPWAEAAGWACMPEASVISCLTSRMSQLPLSPESLIDARKTATRLIRLLPKRARLANLSESNASSTTGLPHWVPLALFLAAILFGLAFELIPQAQTPATVTPPSVEPVVQQPLK